MIIQSIKIIKVRNKTVLLWNYLQKIWLETVECISLDVQEISLLPKVGSNLVIFLLEHILRRYKVDIYIIYILRIC